MSNATAIREQMIQMLEANTTGELFGMLDALATVERGAPEWTVRTMIREIIEGRYDVDAHMEAWVMDDETTLTYDQALRNGVTMASIASREEVAA
jgi:hypothetical protein